VLALTLVVRDEEDILAANLDYHLAQGVDVILAIDHGSSDSTPEILSDYERTGRVHSFRDESRAHDQASRVNGLLRIAAESHGADWVIHCDADEFWLPAAGSLRDVFAAVPDRYGYLIVARNNFLALPEDGRPFHQRLIVRERRSLNIRGEVLEPKVAQRPAAAAAVAPGNHDLEAPVMDPAPDIGAVDVGHYPMRSFEQFERKVVNTGIGYELLQDRAEGVGQDQLELLRMQRSGALRSYYDAQAVDENRLEAGELVLDERLQAVLGDDHGRVEESPTVQQLLRGVWSLAGSTDDARLAAEDRGRELESQLAQLAAELDRSRQETQQLADTLASVRASAIMRYTAPARRAYYRLRPRANTPR